MATDPQSAPPQRPPRRDVHVESSTQLTPHVVRIVAAGDLRDWPAGGPGAHFKVLVPQGDDEPAMRTYTVRAYDPGTARLTIDFVLDGDGPATSWAKHAQPGERFRVSGQARGGFAPEGPCVLAGDHSALPAIQAIVEQLPAGTSARVLVEVPDAAEEQPLTSAAELDVTYLHQHDQEPCTALIAAMHELDLPDADAQIWVGCEADSMRQIRRHLLQERGWNRRAVQTRAYWRRGVVNHSDHDTAEDEI